MKNFSLISNVVSTKLKGSVRDLNSRIIGGSPAYPTRYPYFTYLRLFFQSGSLGFCGGTLVKTDVILTAAHCVLNVNDPIVRIKAYINYTESIIFTWKLTEYVYVRDAKVWIPHKKFNGLIGKNDIGLVILKKPVLEVSPVKLNTDADLPTDGNPVTVIGHGLVSEGATPGYTHFLNEVVISIISFDDCNDSNSWGGFLVKEAQICAGVSTGGRGSCHGDSGGPLLIAGSTASDDLLVGVVSFGSPDDCTEVNYPTVFARVSHYKEWIHNNICQHSNVRLTTCIHSQPTKKPRKKSTRKPTKKLTKMPTKTGIP